MIGEGFLESCTSKVIECQDLCGLFYSSLGDKKVERSTEDGGLACEV